MNREQSTYRVKLAAFEGPLDLLLHLIEQEQLDITTVSLAQVADQYLAYLRLVEEVRPDDLADFLVVAARLLLLKSRALLPKPPSIEEEEIGGDDLVRQLYEYRRFKQAAEFLARRDQDGSRMYPRSLPAARLTNVIKPRLDLGDTSVNDLIAALESLLHEALEESSEPDVVPHKVTIEEQIGRIDTLLQSADALTFGSLLDAAASRVEVIVTLLAVLELIRLRRIIVQQEHLFGEIVIRTSM